jgi:hypothetical protein
MNPTIDTFETQFTKTMKTPNEIRDTYNANFRRAQALAFASLYLDDILNDGCRRMREAMIKMEPKMLPRITELSLESPLNAGILDIVNGALVNAESLDPGKIKPIVDELIGMFGELGKGQFESVENIRRLQDGLLTEQAIVVSVSAFDVMCKEAAVHFLLSDRALLARMTAEMKESDIDEIQALMDCDRGEAMAIVEVQDCIMRRGWLKLFRRIFDDDRFINDNMRIDELDYVRQLRNIIVHNQRRADKVFIDRTGFSGKIGDLVKLEIDEMLEYIHVVDQVSTEVMKSVGIRVD